MNVTAIQETEKKQRFARMVDHVNSDFYAFVDSVEQDAPISILFFHELSLEGTPPQ